MLAPRDPRSSAPAQARPARATPSRRRASRAPAWPLLLLLAAACGRGNAATSDTSPRAIPVDVEQVQRQSLAPPVIATGTLGGKEEVPLSFSTGGIIARILVEEGRAVRAGELLAELSPVPVSAEVAKAEQGRGKAERDLARVRALHRDSIATTEQLQDATTALAVAEQNLKAARFALDHSVVRAPSNGVVLRRLAEPNQVVGAGTAVLIVRTAQRGVVLRAGLPDRDAVRVHLGDSAVVTFDALPGERYRGRVTQRASAASSLTGTYAVELALESRAEPLASGLIGRVEIRTRGEGSLPTLPLEALVEADGDSAAVFVVARGSDRGTRRAVHIARIVGDRVALSSGVEAGEWVVVRGAAYLDDETRIAVRNGWSGDRQ
ncbi:MAG: efflux RND transporter periplasmic adaptor subunit [Gemmatimonadaceae bacterium]|nr:efflux RND transporter periplasmic adaptor subunit [Gemmatimonadaceae bacterium]